MSRITTCPHCGKSGEHTELGVVHGRKLYKCRNCDALWELIEVHQTVDEDDPIRKALL